VVLHLIVIFAIMIPSLVLALIPEYIVRHSYGMVSIITLIHVPLGITVVSFGVWFVISWRCQGLKGCFNRKKLVLATMITWLVSLFFGILLYSIFYSTFRLDVYYLGSNDFLGYSQQRNRWFIED
jgi:hypothetical protein